MATALSLSIDEFHCVLCCEDVEYTACGSCDHPICLKCCLKLRLLRKEYDCPVCRAQLKEVIVSKGYKSWADKMKPCRQQHSRNYGILHETHESQAKVDELLQHKCPECDEIYKSFPQVKEHVRRVHSMIYCDICLRNLKIFTHERKCYTREALVKHRKEGDADDRSHRGHPLCQFCDERYLDNDELLSHLRKNHFWCHLCEKDGSQEYYPQYKELRKHFKQSHFLCEEGECFHEKFTSVFRMKVDFQAHIAQNHSDRLSKAEARQMRQLEVNITFARREDTDSNVSGRDFSFPEQGQERYRSNRVTSDSPYGGPRYKANNRDYGQEGQRRFTQDRNVRVDSERNRGTNMGTRNLDDQRTENRSNMRTSRDVLEGDHKRPPGGLQVDRRIFQGDNGKGGKAEMAARSGKNARESEHGRPGNEDNKKKELSNEGLNSASLKGKQQSSDEGYFSGKGKKTEASLSKVKARESNERSLDEKADGKKLKVENKKQREDSNNQKKDNERQKTKSKNQKEEDAKQKTDNKNQKEEDGKQKTDNKNQKNEEKNQKTDNKNQKPDNKNQKTDNKNQKPDNKSKTKTASNNNLIQDRNTEPSHQEASSVVRPEKNAGPSPSSVVHPEKKTVHSSVVHPEKKTVHSSVVHPETKTVHSSVVHPEKKTVHSSVVPTVPNLVEDFPALRGDDKQGKVVNIVKPRRNYDSEFPTLSNKPSKPSKSMRPPPGLSVPPGFAAEPKQKNVQEANVESIKNFEQVGNSYKAITTSKQPQREILNLEKSLVNKSAAKSKTSVPVKPAPKPTYDSEFPTLMNGHKASSGIKAPPGLAPPGFRPGVPVRPPPGMGWSVPLTTGGSSVTEPRSQTLIKNIRRILNLRGENFVSFQEISSSYRHGKSSPEEYYQQCFALLGEEHIHKVFRELIDFLPDEDKQKQLLLVYNDAKVKTKLGAGVKEESNVQFNTESVVASDENTRTANTPASVEDDFPALAKATTGKTSRSVGKVTNAWSKGNRL